MECRVWGIRRVAANADWHLNPPRLPDTDPFAQAVPTPLPTCPPARFYTDSGGRSCRRRIPLDLHRATTAIPVAARIASTSS